jgi:hypothetical protein
MLNADKTATLKTASARPAAAVSYECNTELIDEAQRVLCLKQAMSKSSRFPHRKIEPLSRWQKVGDEFKVLPVS